MLASEFENHLRRFLRILRKEKTILIKNQTAKLAAIVSQKETFVAVFEQYQAAITPTMQQLISEIQTQQAENLLLTQQAMSYQNMLMTTIKNNMQPASGTYSKYKQPVQPVQTMLVDREV